MRLAASLERWLSARKVPERGVHLQSALILEASTSSRRHPRRPIPRGRRRKTGTERSDVFQFAAKDIQAAKSTPFLDHRARKAGLDCVLVASTQRNATCLQEKSEVVQHDSKGFGFITPDEAARTCRPPQQYPDGRLQIAERKSQAVSF